MMAPLPGKVYSVVAHYAATGEGSLHMALVAFVYDEAMARAAFAEEFDEFHAEYADIIEGVPADNEILNFLFSEHALNHLRSAASDGFVHASAKLFVDFG